MVGFAIYESFKLGVYAIQFSGYLGYVLIKACANGLSFKMLNSERFFGLRVF